MKELLIVLLLLGGGQYVWTHYLQPPTSAPAALTPAVKYPQERIEALARTVRSSEVVMYTTSSCPYCAQAKSWLSQNGFAFKECNMTNSPSCEREFMALGGNGTPFVVLRRNGQTHYMRDGFGSEEFLDLL